MRHLNPVRLAFAAACFCAAPAAAALSPQEALLRAVQEGDLVLAQEALAQGADPKARDSVDFTPLHRAAEHGRLEIARLLLERGAEVNAVSNLGDTPLLWAAEGRHEELVKLLLAKGASTQWDTLYGKPPIHIAAKKGWLNAIRFLLDKGAEVDSLDKHDYTPLVRAARNGKSDNDFETVKLLVERGADVKARAASKQTALHEASVSSNTDPRLLEFLLSKGLDVNSREGNGQTPLMRASFHGAERTVKFLLAKKADPNLEDDMGRAALDFAEEKKRPEVVLLLKAAGARNGSGKRDGGGPAIVRREPPARSSPAETAPAEVKSRRSDVDDPAYKLAESPDNFAMVVGIQRYAGLPEASFAERDARAMRRHLVALGYPERNIFTLIGPDASRAGLAKNLETKLPRLVNERSTVIFYYSGHGAPDPVTGEAYLVPVDGDPEFLKDTAYSLAEIQRRLGALKARKVVVVVDSCFSGVGGRSVLPKGTRPLVTKLKPGLTGSEKLLVMSASENNQISGTAEEQGHGLFTYYFLKGLNGAAGGSPGQATAQGLYDYLKPKVMDEAGRHNRDQVPQMSPQGGEAAKAGLR